VVLYGLADIARSSGASVPSELVARSKYDPSMLVKPLLRYLGEPVMRYDGKAFHEAVSRVGRAFFVGKLKPVDLENVSYKPGTNSGAPNFERKGDAYSAELARAKRIRRGEAPPPAAIFHRGKNLEEVRPVFAYPMAMSLLETRFFEPYQAEVMRHHNPYVGGRTYAQLAGEVNELCWKSSYLLELDYSGFDGSISAKLIHSAFDIIEQSFEMSALDKRDWELVKRYFITCPILLPSGNLVIGKRHGVPSGSMFTQIVDSVVNAICIEYWKLRSGARVSRYHVMGDDSVVGLADSKPSLQTVSETILELGIQVNLRKSKVRRVGQEYPYFLGHYWHHMKPTREVEETWEKVLTPERAQLEFFAKDKEIVRRAWIDRLRAYQDDNQDPEAWRQLQVVIDMLRSSTLRQVSFDHDAYRFKPGKAIRERSDWDVNVQWLIKSQTPGFTHRHLYAF
jgi:hypothetical protein